MAGGSRWLVTEFAGGRPEGLTVVGTAHLFSCLALQEKKTAGPGPVCEVCRVPALRLDW